MLKSISTTEFLSFLTILTCIYYVVVLIKYYRKDMKGFWIRQFKKQKPTGGTTVVGEAIEPAANLEPAK
jgi:hypothetical protein